MAGAERERPKSRPTEVRTVAPATPVAELAARIEDALPQTQCTRCGYPDCHGYAQAIANGEADINRCPPGGHEGIRRLAAITDRPVRPLDETCGVEGPLRLAVIEVEDKVTVIINPEIIKSSGEHELDEGCLSVPGFWGRLLRAERVSVKAQDRSGREQRIRDAEGLFAQALQHEIDHLDGHLYIDRMETLDSLQRSEPLRKREVDARRARAAEEGLDDEELALFDLLFKPDISKADRERLKQASRSLLSSLRELLPTMQDWTEKTATQSAVRVHILNNLYEALPRPPFTETETDQIAERVYDYVWQRSVSSDGLYAA